MDWIVLDVSLDVARLKGLLWRWGCDEEKKKDGICWAMQMGLVWYEREPLGVKAKHWKKEKKKESSRHEKKKKERKEETEKQMWKKNLKKKNLVIRQDTKYWVPFVDKNYWKCHLTLFSIFKNSQIVFSNLVSHHSKTRKLNDGNITE